MEEEEKRSVESKKDCYLLYEKGFFGNKALTWNSFDEILKSGWKGEVCIRSRVGTARTNVVYNIPIEKVKSEVEKLKEKGIDEGELTFNQSMPDENLSIQGEIMLTERGLYFLHTFVKKPMNLGLREEAKHAWGLKARMLLEKNLYPASLSDIYALLEIFPDAVIEFSAYNAPVGSVPGRNTVIWEVRNY